MIDQGLFRNDRRRLLGIGTLLAGVARAADLKVGDKAPPFTLQGSDGKTYSLADFKGKKAVVARLVPQGVHRRLHRRVQVVPREGRRAEGAATSPTSPRASTRPDDNKKFAESLDADYPILSDPDKSVAKAYGVLNAERGSSPTAGPSTSTRTASSRRSTRRSNGPRQAAADVAAKVKELGLARA